MDLFGIALAVIVGVVVLLVVRTARVTRARIGGRTRGTGDIAQARADEVKCVRCGASTFMPAGTRNGYPCEVCRLTFGGPPHMADTGG